MRLPGNKSQSQRYRSSHMSVGWQEARRSCSPGESAAGWCDDSSRSDASHRNATAPPPRAKSPRSRRARFGELREAVGCQRWGHFEGARTRRRDDSGVAG
jgi:hypothetical protein